MSRLPPNYRKKIVNSGSGRALTETYSSEQVRRRISFYKELNGKRDRLERCNESVTKRFALFGWDDTTTVRVYMRETVSRIAAELFYSDYTLTVENLYAEHADGTADRDHGRVVVTLCATKPEYHALMKYLVPGSSYYVYDGEKSKYVPGNTASSEFIIVKPGEKPQPEHYWRRSQSFIQHVQEMSEHV
jgi:hypothetical protein